MQMVKLSVREIRDIIKPVGLSPMKSKGIHGLSEILINDYGVKFQKVLKLWKPYLQLVTKQRV